MKKLLITIIVILALLCVVGVITPSQVVTGVKVIVLGIVNTVMNFVNVFV